MPVATTVRIRGNLAAAQPLDSDLTAIAAITPINDDLIQRKAGVWVNRTPVQIRADMGLDAGGSGDIWVEKAGDTMTGNLTIDKANPVITLRDATGATPIISMYDTTDGGVNIYEVDGTLHLGQANTAGSTIADYLTITKTTGLATFSGNVLIDRAAPNITLHGTDAGGGSAISMYDSTDGGWNMITDEGQLYFQSLSGTPAFLGNAVYFDKSGGITVQAIGATSQPTINIMNAAANVQSNIIFYDNGVGKWYLYKRTDNVFAIWNSALGADVMQFPVAGGVAVPALAGTGSRMVEASASGSLSATKTPAMDLLAVTAPGATSVDFNSVFSATYDVYMLNFSMGSLATTGAEIYMRFGTSGVDDAGASSYRSTMLKILTGSVVAQGLGTTVVYLSPFGIAGVTLSDVSANVWIFNPFSASVLTRANVLEGIIQSGSDWNALVGSGNYGTAKSHTDVSIFVSSGTPNNLHAELYGMRKA